MYDDSYSDDERYEYTGDDDDEYDRSEPALTRKSTAEYEQERAQYDTSSYRTEDESYRTRETSESTAKSKQAERGYNDSFRTREPSVSGKSSLSKQSHRSKHSKATTNHSSGVYSGWKERGGESHY